MKKLMYIVALTLACQMPLFAKTFYISASNTVTATNLKTIDALNTKFPGATDSVLFKRGEVFRGQIKKYCAYFGAYGTGAKPIILGSAALTGWTVASGSGSNTIWKANYKSNVYQLFVDTARQTIARWPNTGWQTAASPSSYTTVTASGIPSGVTGATVRARINDWAYANAAITGQSAGNITTAGLSAGSVNFSSGYGFYIDGLLSLLDADNEWVSQPGSTGYDVYYNPVGSVDPNTLSIEGSVYYYAFGNGADEPVSDGITDWNVSNQNLDNLDIRYQAWDAVWYFGAGSSNNRITNCDFRGQYFGAMELMGSNIYVDKCTFNDISSNAIYMYQCSNSTVKNSSFTNIGGIAGYGRQGDYTMIGLASDGGGSGTNNYFGYNKLTNIGGSGIYTSGTNAIVEKNIARYTNMNTNDQGSFYCYGLSTSTAGTIFRNNFSYYTQGNGAGATNNAKHAHGVYFDGGSTYVTAINNTVVQPSGDGFLGNGGTNNHQIKNNVVYGAASGLIELAGWNTISNYTITGNELYAKAATEPILRIISTSGNYSGMATSDNNYYVNAYVANASANIIVRNTAFGTSSNTTLASWKSLQGQDANTKGSFYYGVNSGTDKSVLFTNTTDVAQVYTLSCAYKDLNDANITSFTLQPYTSRILINVNSCTSVITETTDAQANSMFSVYPNPTEGSINITSKNGTDVSATLYNYTGTSLVKVEGSLEDVNSKINEVFAGQKAGLYIIHLNDGANTSDLKVIKK